MGLVEGVKSFHTELSLNSLNFWTVLSISTYNAQNSTEAWDTGHANGLSKTLEKEMFERRKHSLSDCYIPQFSSIAVAKFPTGLSIGMETVSQSYPAGKLQPNYYGSAVTQSL